MKTDTDNVSFMSVTTDKNMKKYRDKKNRPYFDVSSWRLSSLHHEMKICTEFIKFLCICIQGVNIFMKFNSIKRERIISESSKIFILEAISETFEHNLFKSSIDKPINSLLNN